METDKPSVHELRSEPRLLVHRTSQYRDRYYRVHDGCMTGEGSEWTAQTHGSARSSEVLISSLTS